MLPRMTHMEVVPRNGRVEFHIDIDDRATITADAGLEETKEIIEALDEEGRDDTETPMLDED